MNPIHRRAFLKQLALTSFVLTVPGGLTRVWAAAGPAKPIPLPPGQIAVPPTDAVALAIGYKPDVKDIDFKKYPDRKKPAAKNQFCKNCALFTSVNEGWGKCTMLANGLVAAQGWCGSYSKQA